MNEELESIRRDIDKVDSEIAELLCKRRSLVSTAGKLKENKTIPKYENRVNDLISEIKDIISRDDLDCKIVGNNIYKVLKPFILQELLELDLSVIGQIGRDCKCDSCKGFTINDIHYSNTESFYLYRLILIIKRIEASLTEAKIDKEWEDAIINKVIDITINPTKSLHTSKELLGGLFDWPGDLFG